jgi:superfamily II DNA or RNA helicase/ubiquinone/menaquinone biosynthesis C-methylase UbiE
MSLRECQQKAIACINERKQESETNISMCTGAGKSIVIREINKDTSRRILVFPWLDLMVQFYDSHKDAFTSSVFRYFATEGTLTDIPRLSASMSELNTSSYVIFTTYTSAPLIYAQLCEGRDVDLLTHDEAHRIERPEYKEAFSKVTRLIKRIANLSATLPSTKEIHYKYSLLRGIKDRVVRDFHMELFLCVSKERNESALLFQIIEKLKSLHKEIKLLIYTAEANTENNDTSSVLTFMNMHSDSLRKKGYWIEGIKADTKDRKKVLRDFEVHREVSLLVSCKTLSEGIDLKNVNCMLPWDPSSSPVENIQRIGRALRLLKDKKGEFKKEQTASTILIPIFLEEEKYKACGGNREAIHDVLSKEISEGEKGNFRPIVNVCTALKEELAEDDPELFNRLLDYPHESKVAVTKDLVDCVAKQCKKSSETVLEEVVEKLQDKLDGDQLEELQEGEWDISLNGDVVQALADTQGITLVVKDGDEVEIYGSGTITVTVEKKDENDYAIVKGKKEVSADKEAAQKRVAQRMRINFSDECQILLGLNSIEGADTTGGMVLTRLTTEVHYDEQWEKRRLEWVAIYEKLGRCPVWSSSYPDEKLLAHWQQNQRSAYKNQAKHMTSQRIKALESTKGWKWEEGDTWEPIRKQWEDFYKKVGRNPNKHLEDEVEKFLGNWQGTQRKLHRKDDPQMTPQRIQALSSTPGWKWEEDDKWQTSYSNWIDQYKKLGRAPTQSAIATNEEQRAGSWQQNQRAQYRKKNKNLSLERISILEETYGWTWIDGDIWETNRQNWMMCFKKKKGRYPSGESLDEDERKAAKWQSHQRENYKKKKLLSIERIDLLENHTPGWIWEDNSWELSRQKWIEFFQKSKKLPSTGTNDECERNAAIWQNSQRQNFKNKKLNVERINILNETQGWDWGEEDPWQKHLNHWILQYANLKRFPSRKAKDEDERISGQWQTDQRYAYANKKLSMTLERIQILETTVGWQWKGEDTWETNRQGWASYFSKIGSNPSAKSKDAHERKLGGWKDDQRKNYKRKNVARMTTERIKILEATPGWTWSDKEEPKTPYVASSTPQPRTRKPIQTKEGSGSGTKRQLSQLEEFHKRFKTMNAATYKNSISQEDFTEYHKVADSYDAKDPVERQPIHKIAELLSKYNKPTYSAIDLGCGKNRLRKLESVAKMNWTSVDVHAIDESVTLADMSALPYEDESYDFAILSRSLWARNHMDVLKETYRILKSGGRAIVCESFQRWMNEQKENELLQDLGKFAFEVVFQEGTSMDDKILDVFQYIIVRKI